MLAFGSVSLAQEVGCLGFPAAQNFSCVYESLLEGAIKIEVDLPSGFGCNQPPLMGLITVPSLLKEIDIYSPRVSYGFTRDGGRVNNIRFYRSQPNQGEPITIKCVSSEEP